MDYSPSGFSVCRILQARILEWVAIPSLQGSLPNPGIKFTSLASPEWAGWLFTTSATWLWQAMAKPDQRVFCSHFRKESESREQRELRNTPFAGCFVSFPIILLICSTKSVRLGLVFHCPGLVDMYDVAWLSESSPSNFVRVSLSLKWKLFSAHRSLRFFRGACRWTCLFSAILIRSHGNLLWAKTTY